MADKCLEELRGRGMTREEIIKIFEENHIAEGNATINATKLAEIFTKRETDLLKKFVKTINFVLIDDDRFDLENEIRIMAVVRNTLENFLKEKK